MSLTTVTAPSQMLIGGAWINACNGGQIAIENPATKQPIQEVPRAEGEDVDNAVRAAQQAFASWSKTVPRDRGPHHSDRNGQCACHPGAAGGHDDG